MRNEMILGFLSLTSQTVSEYQCKAFFSKLVYKTADHKITDFRKKNKIGILKRKQFFFAGAIHHHKLTNSQDCCQKFS
jgi:hypothetical protein